MSHKPPFVAGIFGPGDLLLVVGKRARERRIALSLRQADLALRAGVSERTVRRFEDGDDAISVGNLARIALALAAEVGVTELFPPVPVQSLDDVLQPRRKRVRVRRSPHA